MAPDTAEAQPQSPLSVVFVSRYFHPFTGGLEKRVGAVAAALAARGISVTVLTGCLSPEHPRTHVHKGVSIHRLVCPRIKVIGACVFIAQLMRFLFRERRRYQFLHAFQVGHSSAAAVLLARLLGKRSFLHLSGGGSGGDVGRHLKTPWGWVFLLLCRSASSIVVLNAQMQREVKVLAYPSDRTVCIPNGVDTGFYQPHRDRCQLRRALGLPLQPIILYTGRLSAEKGVGVLVRAHARLRSTAAPFLVIIGGGPEQLRLERLIRKLGTGSTVMLSGEQSDILRWYQCADIFVMPSFHEGMSNSVLEAMACGLPVIATAVSGNSDLVSHGRNGLLVPPNDPAALAAALDSLLENPESARALGARGRQIAQTQFCFDTMIKSYCALYRRMDL